MMRTWFAEELETAATFWRVLRRDGIAVGFTSHDRDLWFDGILHRASPGMVPSSIRKCADLEPDSAEVRGALTHETIDGADLVAGRFDGAQVRIGLVDWESLERLTLYEGTLGTITQEDGLFSADLVSRKAELWRDLTPRTSPSCRASFCGPGCNLNPQKHTRELAVAGVDASSNTVRFSPHLDGSSYAGGTLRWLDGPQAGLSAGVMNADEANGLVLDLPVDDTVTSGTRVLLQEGCDRTLDTCAVRFHNAVNFRGEPFLPGNDMLTRYPVPA
ncbi:DUF2163 domain-containing protein [Novosphingobium panipatense]|nr:DUF2163 domain-containing protein [Novosphingobium panipatense]